MKNKKTLVVLLAGSFVGLSLAFVGKMVKNVAKPVAETTAKAVETVAKPVTEVAKEVTKPITAPVKEVAKKVEPVTPTKELKKAIDKVKKVEVKPVPGIAPAPVKPKMAKPATPPVSELKPTPKEKPEAKPVPAKKPWWKFW